MTAEQIKDFQYDPDATPAEGLEYSPKHLLERLFNLRKPSDIIDVMCYGLRDQDARPDYRVHMETYGDTETSYCADGKTAWCCGCAATAALGMLLPDTFQVEDGDDDQWLTRVCSGDDHVYFMCHLENFFDALRSGEAHVWRPWVEVDDLSITLVGKFANLRKLRTDTWVWVLPDYEEWAKQAREAGY